MKSRHIILRSFRGATRDTFDAAQPAFRSAAFAAPEPAAARVEVDELRSEDVPRVTADASVVAVAPVMPVKLIEPRSSDAAAAAVAGWGIAAVKADVSTETGAGITVAVLDTGIDPAHAAFQGVDLVRANFTLESPDDLHGHGTHCAGTIFGRDVTGTRIGVARGVSKALIGKVLGAGGNGSDQVAQAIEWAANLGANVISMSLGIDFPGWVKQLEAGGMPVELATSRALVDYRANVRLFDSLAGLLRAKSVFGPPTLVVAAAGNESRRDLNPDWVISVSPPALADGFISCGAVQQGAQGFEVAGFSNTGANLVAPGVDIVSAKAGGGLRTMSGTSMATPHVAGVAALWGERLRGLGALTLQEWTARLVGSGTRQGMNGAVAVGDIGAGLVQSPI